MTPRSRVRSFGVILASVVALHCLALPSALGDVGAGMACAKDTDCKGDLICQAGRCAPPSAPQPSPARVDPAKVRCAQANIQAQDLRREAKLTAAREQLQSCMATSCPAVVRDDCTRRLDELERAQPTIIFEVKDASGADVFAVTVTMDGKPWADSLEGKALRADPGRHVFTFTAASHPAATRTLAVTEGDKGRRERIVLEEPPRAPVADVVEAPAPAAAPAGPPTLPAPPSAPPPPVPETTGEGAAPGESSGGMGAQRIWGLLVGGVGIAGLGAGTAFGLLAMNAWGNAKTACGGNPSVCTNVPAGQSYKSTASEDATVATVGFIAGGVLLGAGAVLFLTGGSREGAKPLGLVVAPAAGPRELGLSATAVF